MLMCPDLPQHFVHHCRTEVQHLQEVFALERCVKPRYEDLVPVEICADDDHRGAFDHALGLAAMPGDFWYLGRIG